MPGAFGPLSFSTRIVLLIIAVLAAVSIAVAVLTERDVSQAMEDTAEQAATNALHLTLLNIENQWKGLVFHRQSALDARSADLRHLTAGVVAYADRAREAASRGELSPRAAQALVLDWVKAFRFGRDDYFYIYNEQLVAIAHPDPAYMGRSMADFQDVKGTYVVRELMRGVRTSGDVFLPYWWRRLDQNQPVRKLGYSVWYAPWRWMIGTGVYIDDIDAEEAAKRAAMVTELRETFARTTIGARGSLVLFDGRKQVLIGGAASTMLTTPIGATDRTPLDEAIGGTNAAQTAIEYVTPDGVVIRMYVARFEPLDWYVAALVPAADIRAPGRRLVVRQTAVIGAIFLLSAAAAALLVRRIARPLNTLAAHARRLATPGFALEISPELQRLAARPRDEIGNLATAFAEMTSRLRQYLSDLTTTTRAKEQIESELRIAHDLQMSRLPRRIPAFPGRTEIDVHAAIEPAREVGGDFYDFFLVDEHRLGFAIGDVSDKGILAALFMSASQTMIRTLCTAASQDRKDDVDAGAVLSRVNSELCQDNALCMFVTVFLGILDLRTGDLRYSCGAHTRPCRLAGATGEVVEIECAGARPLGLRDDSRYETRRTTLRAGDMLFLYTDGVTEALDPHGETFGMPRLVDALTGSAGSTPQDTIARVLDRVRAFVNAAPAADDVTMLCVQYRGPHGDESCDNPGPVEMHACT